MGGTIGGVLGTIVGFVGFERVGWIEGVIFRITCRPREGSFPKRGCYSRTNYLERFHTL
jgi:hypothetical protein